ncbi:MAG: RICIN domain-containing protein [Clostridia bacterium]|nr:RICIN domain-containing protein [Clostridia bacterium]
MKKIIAIIGIILLIELQLFFPYYSYAEEQNVIIKDENIIVNKENLDSEVNIEQEEKQEFEEEKEEEVKNSEKNEIEEVVINSVENDRKKSRTIEENVKLEEGIYKIVMATNVRQSLTVDGGRTNDGANVHLWEYQGANQQKFEIKYDAEGYCEIIPTHSGKRIDVVGWGNEANVDQWSENGGNNNQKWVIKKSKRGNYNIVSKRENLYLDAYQSKIQNGTNIQVYEASGGNGQEFKLEKIADKEEIPSKTVEEGTYKIVMATNTNQSLTVDGGRMNNGANVHLWEYLDTMQQQFNLVYDGKGYYEIIPIHSGKRLDVVGWGNEANVEQWSNNGGGDNQKWQIKKSKAGNYNIISKRENRYLDVYQSKIVNGTNVEVYEASGGNGQEFQLKKIESKSEKTVQEKDYKITPQVNNNLVIEASGSNYDNDGRIQIWQDYDVPAQKLSIEYIDGYYRIALKHSGKYLTVKNRKIERGSEVIQYEWNWRR